MGKMGGKRPGAGRPKKPRMTRVSVSLDPIQVEYLIMVARENHFERFSDAISHVINLRVIARSVGIER